MQKRTLFAFVAFALLIALCLNVYAYHNSNTPEATVSTADVSTATSSGGSSSTNAMIANVLQLASNNAETALTATPLTGTSNREGVDLHIDGQLAVRNAPSCVVNGITYISIEAVVEAIIPEATVQWQDNRLIVDGHRLTLSACPDDLYVSINGRYLYVPEGVTLMGDAVMAPLDVICNALGASLQALNEEQEAYIATIGLPLASGTFYYDADILYWLSRIIDAESRNQPLAGQIAVGTVIMNRVASTQFPDTPYDVIFQKNQFDPVELGTIYRDPSPQAVIAAKLVLDGAREAGESLFFHRSDLVNSWTAQNKTFVETIADHSFYL